MATEQQWAELSKEMLDIFNQNASPDKQTIIELLEGKPAAAIALAMESLKPEQAVTVFKVLDTQHATEVLALLEPELTKQVLSKMPNNSLSGLVAELSPREAATVVTEAPRRHIRQYLKNNNADPATLMDAETRLRYPKGSAGRIMTTQFSFISTGTTVEQALQAVRQADTGIDMPDDLYIVNPQIRNKAEYPGRFRLLGVVSVKDLLLHEPSTVVDNIMAKDTVAVSATATDDDAAALIAKYKFLTLPVLDEEEYLVGVIPIDVLMQVVVGRERRLYTQAVGTDAEAMERMSPLKAAKLRVPWLLGTMLIELVAGIVISHFNGVLEKVILLASFMPVISAISGNVGLQAAAITVRALDITKSKRKSLTASLFKEAATALLMALACGLVLGTIGAIWSRHLPFGIVIGVALTCSMLTAGLMGTIIPVLSKRLGFDPATTAGPFETAFQDVIGFSVFLWLATLLQHWIS